MLSQPSLAELPDHFCPTCGSTKVSAVMPGDVFYPAGSCCPSPTALWRAMCSASAECLKMRDTFYKPYRYHYNCWFFQLETCWTLLVIACLTDFMDLIPWGSKQSLAEVGQKGWFSHTRRYRHNWTALALFSFLNWDALLGKLSL